MINDRKMTLLKKICKFNMYLTHNFNLKVKYLNRKFELKTNKQSKVKFGEYKNKIGQ